ncbi:hypothetical protein HMPREF0971_00482 [Segatella oris F0302]|uniref:Uncharacterized protein n=1 Tax=Segatella oris F0302 TaxID=649760 RepID=D1QNE6_9BACT|nr:hypothetical protein HMPREF0971_00482 [Segatella oris F0302]
MFFVRIFFRILRKETMQYTAPVMMRRMLKVEYTSHLHGLIM